MAGVRVTYQPFSLQERMAPLNMMKEEYDTVNEGLSELGMTANQVAQYIDPASQAGQTLAQYNKLLDDTASTLSREGLKGVSRTTLQNLRRMYQKQVAPINESAKNYASLQAKIKEMQWKDPTIMVNNMPTLDDYIKNPNALPNLVSGSQLMKEGAAAALQLQGVDYNAISRYMQGDVSAIPNLDKSVQQIAQSYGVTSQQAFDYISRGVLNGLGERATKLDMARQNAEMEYDYKMRLERFQQGQQNYRTRVAADADMARLRLAGRQGGYVYNDKTKDWEFSPEVLKEAEQSYQATHKSSTSTTPKNIGQETTNYNPLKGTHFIQKDGRSDTKAKGRGEIVSTQKLTEVASVDQLNSLFEMLNINFDASEYSSPYDKNVIDWDRVIEDYGGYLDKYEFKYYERRGTLEVNQRGANTKVTTSSNKVANKYGIEPPQQAKDEEDDGSDALG